MTRILTPAIVCLTALFLLASPVLGHSALDSASPGPDDEVVGSPSEIVAQFTQDLDPSRTSMSVRDAAGKVVAEGGELGPNPREWRLPLPELAPGAYEVRYTTFSSEDGELHRSQYTFTVLAAPSPSPSPTPSPTAGPTVTPEASPSQAATPEATPEPTPTPAPSPDPASGTDGSAVLAIVLALAVVGAVGFWILRRRAT